MRCLTSDHPTVRSDLHVRQIHSQSSGIAAGMEASASSPPDLGVKGGNCWRPPRRPTDRLSDGPTDQRPDRPTDFCPNRPIDDRGDRLTPLPAIQRSIADWGYVGRIHPDRLDLEV